MMESYDCWAQAYWKKQIEGKFNRTRAKGT